MEYIKTFYSSKVEGSSVNATGVFLFLCKYWKTFHLLRMRIKITKLQIFTVEVPTQNYVFLAHNRHEGSINASIDLNLKLLKVVKVDGWHVFVITNPQINK